MTPKEIQTALAAPFSAEDIEWRLQQCGGTKDKLWAMCLAYVTNRAIMQRLDDVVGAENWQNNFEPAPTGGLMCAISIKIGGEWITKRDGAENTDIEAVKGGMSGAMKRAAVQWGIGRYLYNLEEGFAVITDKGQHRGKTKDGISFKWNPPVLPSWALPDKKKTAPATPTPEVPSGEPPATSLSYEQLEAKILAIDNFPHLKNTWEKYQKDIQALSKEGLKMLTAIKDYQKKLIEVCPKKSAGCEHTIGGPANDVGCSINHRDCKYTGGK